MTFGSIVSVEEDTIDAQQPIARIVIVIPTLNECKAVGKVVTSIKSVMSGYNYRVLIVDGHSIDGIKNKERIIDKRPHAVC